MNTTNSNISFKGLRFDKKFTELALGKANDPFATAKKRVLNEMKAHFDKKYPNHDIVISAKRDHGELPPAGYSPQKGFSIPWQASCEAYEIKIMAQEKKHGFWSFLKPANKASTSITIGTKKGTIPYSQKRRTLYNPIFTTFDRLSNKIKNDIEHCIRRITNNK